MTLQAQACSFIKKETLAEVFSSEFCEISKNIFFTENLRMTASPCNELNNIMKILSEIAIAFKGMTMFGPIFFSLTLF